MQANGGATSQGLAMGLILSAGAGLATTVGSLIGLAARKPGPRLMGFVLGFSAGIMLFVSFVELLRISIDRVGFCQANAALLFGILVFFLVDILVPHDCIGQEDHAHVQGSEASVGLRDS